MTSSPAENSPLLLHQPSIVTTITNMPDHLKESTGVPLFEPVMLTQDELSEGLKFLKSYCGQHYNRSTLKWIIAELYNDGKITEVQKTRAETLINEKAVDEDVLNRLSDYLLKQPGSGIQEGDEGVPKFIHSLVSDSSAIQSIFNTNAIAFEPLRDESLFFGSYKYAPSPRLLFFLSLAAVVGMAAVGVYMFKQYFNQVELENATYRNDVLGILYHNKKVLEQNITSSCKAQRFFTEQDGICPGSVASADSDLTVCGQNVGMTDPNNPVFESYFNGGEWVDNTIFEYFNPVVFKKGYSVAFAILNVIFGGFAYNLKNLSNKAIMSLTAVFLLLAFVPDMVSRKDRLLKVRLCYALNNYLVQIAGNVTTVVAGSKPDYVNAAGYSLAFEKGLIPALVAVTFLCGFGLSRFQSMYAYLTSGFQCEGNNEQAERVDRYSQHMTKGMRMFSQPSQDEPRLSGSAAATRGPART